MHRLHFDDAVRPKPTNARLRVWSLILALLAVQALPAWWFLGTRIVECLAIVQLKKGNIDAEEDDQPFDFPFRRQRYRLHARGHIDNAALSAIDGLPLIEFVLMQDSTLDDEGLAHLATRTDLKTLYIGRTRISEEGLRNLEGCRALQDLDLTGTEVGEAAIARLKAALPNCNVDTRGIGYQNSAQGRR